MKRIVITSMVIAFIATLLTSSQASDRSIEGLIIGGGTGAIVGQAIGHTPHSTIAGAVVGGAVGVIIGSTMNSHHREVRHHSRRVFSHSGTKYHPRRPKVYRETIHHYDHHTPVRKHGYKKKKRHHKKRPVFSHHYNDYHRHHNKHAGRKRSHHRF